MIRLYSGEALMAKKSISPLATAVGAAVLVSSAAAAAAADHAASANPFAADKLSTGYNLAMNDQDKDREGKCGDKKKEGNCGDKKKEGKCGDDKMKDKKKEGKCGEGKCGDDKKEQPQA